jgi:hypothetical protein
MYQQQETPTPTSVDWHTPTRLNYYLNARVNVHYENSYTDQGIVSYLDNHWVELTKDNGERLLIPTSAIRIIKLIELAKREADAEMLLRPYENAPQIEPKRESDE